MGKIAVPADSEFILSCWDLNLRENPCKMGRTGYWFSVSSIRFHRIFKTSIILNKNLFRIGFLLHDNQRDLKEHIFLYQNLKYTQLSCCLISERKWQLYIYATHNTKQIPLFAVMTTWPQVLVLQHKSTLLNILLQLHTMSFTPRSFMLTSRKLYRNGVSS